MTESKSFNRTATVLLTVMVVFAMMPILLIVIASFSSESSLIRNGYTYLPEEWSFDAYYYMVKQGVMIVRSYGVSFLVTFAGTAISVILTTMLAYPMSRKSLNTEMHWHSSYFLQCYSMAESYHLILCGQSSSRLKIQYGH